VWAPPSSSACLSAVVSISVSERNLTGWAFGCSSSPLPNRLHSASSPIVKEQKEARVLAHLETRRSPDSWMKRASLLRRNRREELHPNAHPVRFLSDTDMDTTAERHAEDDGGAHTHTHTHTHTLYVVWWCSLLMNRLITHTQTHTSAGARIISKRATDQWMKDRERWAERTEMMVVCVSVCVCYADVCNPPPHTHTQVRDQ